MFGNMYQTAAKTIAALIEGFKAYRQYNRGYRELAALDDRQLRDIGISRSMIGSVAVTGAYRASEAGVWDSDLVSNRERPTKAA